VIDVACGPGVFPLHLAPYVREIVGLELTPALLNEAQRLQKAARTWNVRWVIGEAGSLPFGDGAFSLVVCSGSFHHFDDPVGVLAEMVRVCRPGGRIAINAVTPEAGNSAAYDQLELLRDPKHRHAHTVDEMRALGAAAQLVPMCVDTRTTDDMSLVDVLAASPAGRHSQHQIEDLLRTDASSGDDRHGLHAHLSDGKLMVNYTTTTFVWRKP
jgi:ubiquinone/menaquinone biosynthesis C-methylase UbiE